MDNLREWMIDPPAWTCVAAILLAGVILGLVMKR